MSTPLRPGTRVGPFEVVELLGRGGMGAVYKGFDPTLNRHLALKILRGEFLEDPSFAERFRREAQIWGRLDHPSIVPVYLADIEGQHPFLAMRYLAGGSLSDLLKHGPLPLERAIALLSDVAAALDYAHSQAIVHRDVKPANVLLDEEGKPYLSDFGIARVVAADRPTAPTGGIVGTPGYMAPEQARHQQPDPRSDIYSLGCMAYEMITGTPPFKGDTPVDVLMRHIMEHAAPPSEVVPGLPAHVEKAILKAIAKDPDHRWPTASLFVQALLGKVDIEFVQTVSLHPPATPRTGPRPAGATPTTQPVALWSRVPVRLLASVGLLLMAGLALLLARPAPPPPVGPLARPSASPAAPVGPPAGLRTAFHRFMDEGDYEKAQELAEAAVRLHPEDSEAQAMLEHVKRAWEAERALGLWPSPSPSASAEPASPRPTTTPGHGGGASG